MYHIRTVTENYYSFSEPYVSFYKGQKDSLFYLAIKLHCQS